MTLTPFKHQHLSYLYMKFRENQMRHVRTTNFGERNLFVLLILSATKTSVWGHHSVMLCFKLFDALITYVVSSSNPPFDFLTVLPTVMENESFYLSNFSRKLHKKKRKILQQILIESKTKDISNAWAILCSTMKYPSVLPSTFSKNIHHKEMSLMSTQVVIMFLMLKEKTQRNNKNE